jgi:hypothetical protein
MSFENDPKFFHQLKYNEKKKEFFDDPKCDCLRCQKNKTKKVSKKS